MHKTAAVLNVSALLSCRGWVFCINGWFSQYVCKFSFLLKRLGQRVFRSQLQEAVPENIIK